MDVRQLNSLVTIVECTSFTRAAERLHVAQPALGTQIRKLEEELQVKLLVRHSRGVAPTDAGVVLLQHARRILADVAQARVAMATFAGTPHGNVVVGLTPSVNFMLSPRLIKACAAGLPGVMLSIEEQLSVTLLEWVAEGRIDFALAHRAASPPGVTFEPMFSEPLYLICRKADAPPGADTVTLGEVAECPLILAGLPHGLRKLLADRATAAGLTLRVSFEMQSVAMVRDLVADGIGMTVLPYGGALRSVSEATLAIRRIVEPEIVREVHLAYGVNAVSNPAMLAVRELIVAQVQEVVRSAGGAWSGSAPGSEARD